jgi:SAM-dependent methyltransferase
MRLNLASGTHPAAGWINCDLLPQDGLQLRCDVARLPFADASVAQLYAGHLLEHVPLGVLPLVLAEWRRVLAPGGELMVVQPDIDRAVRAREPWWLLESIIAHGDGPGGHAWTSSSAVLLHLLWTHGWEVDEVDVATVTEPEWPNVAPEAAWQVAVRCR